MVKPCRALISVWDKSGVAEFAQSLAHAGVEILSTAKTAQLLREHGVEVIEVSNFTGAPEVLGGRVKTLHPSIFAGILSYRGQHGDEGKDIRPIDIVAVSLYPFEDSVKKGLGLQEMVELIDIGGVSLLRAAAKNYEHVVSVPDPMFYAEVSDELARMGGITLQTRQKLACETFARIAYYDGVISRYLARELAGNGSKRFANLSLVRSMPLRYGENPHQRAGYYVDPFSDLEIRQLGGKELSYNNLLDIDSALGLLEAFAAEAEGGLHRTSRVCVIIKHNTPCGVAVHNEQVAAFVNAREADAQSAFGGIVGLNTDVDEATAEEMAKTFFEVIVAPGFTPAALVRLSNRRNLRVVEYSGRLSMTTVRSALGGLLIQDADKAADDVKTWKVVSRRQPTQGEMADLRFAWTVASFVRSNAIVLAKDKTTTGVGAGQMSRVDSVRIAIQKAGERSAGSVLASDGFFPFRDSVDLAAAHHITALAEPGGSVRDEEVIRAADEKGLTLVFTGRRHFRH